MSKEQLKEALENGILTRAEYKKKLALLENPKERFEWQRFKKIFSLFSPVEWIKTLKEIGILDVRKWVVYALIIGSMYGYGYFKGIGNKPVSFDMRGKEAHIALNEHFLHITPDGSAQVEDENGNILKKIRVGDIPELKKALKPIGMDINPFFTSGVGLGEKSGASLEAGVGTQLFKFYKIHLDTWLTNRGIYIGTDYQITQNFSAIGGMGKGYDGDTRGYFGGMWKF